QRRIGHLQQPELHQLHDFDYRLATGSDGDLRGKRWWRWWWRWGRRGNANLHVERKSCIASSARPDDNQRQLHQPADLIRLGQYRPKGLQRYNEFGELLGWNAQRRLAYVLGSRNQLCRYRQRLAAVDSYLALKGRVNGAARSARSFFVLFG